MLAYKGYTGQVAYDDEARLFHGEVLHTRDLITFSGTTVDEIEQAFRDSIDEYLAWCAEEGVPAEKPYSGTFNLRISPDLHKELVRHARREGKSLNSFVEEVLQERVTYLGSRI